MFASTPDPKRCPKEKASFVHLASYIPQFVFDTLTVFASTLPSCVA